MSATTTPAGVTPSDTDLEVEEPGPSAWRALSRTLEGRVGLALIVALAAVIVFGPTVAPYEPSELGTGLPSSAPSADHLLGTDQVGRDVLSRLLNGGRTVVLVPLAATALAFLVGGAVGMFGAYRGGLPDATIARTFDLLLSIPALLLILVLVTGLGTDWWVLILSVALVTAPRAGRIVRGATQAVVGQSFVEAAQLRGERLPTILWRELLPNAAPPILAAFALYLTYSIIAVSTLSFLGLGAQPPSSDWGLMVAESRGFIRVNPWATVAPALGIAALAVAFTLISDAVSRHVARDQGDTLAPV